MKAKSLCLTPSQIEQRQKQIDLTKKSTAYIRYRDAVKKSERSIKLSETWHPSTPIAKAPISRSQFVNKLRLWRKKIYHWDNISSETYEKIKRNNEITFHLDTPDAPIISNFHQFDGSGLQNSVVSSDRGKDLSKSIILPDYGNNITSKNCKPTIFLPEDHKGVLFQSSEVQIINEKVFQETVADLKKELSRNSDLIDLRRLHNTYGGNIFEEISKLEGQSISLKIGSPQKFDVNTDQESKGDRSLTGCSRCENTLTECYEETTPSDDLIRIDHIKDYIEFEFPAGDNLAKNQRF